MSPQGMLYYFIFGHKWGMIESMSMIVNERGAPLPTQPRLLPSTVHLTHAHATPPSTDPSARCATPSRRTLQPQIMRWVEMAWQGARVDLVTQTGQVLACIMSCRVSPNRADISNEESDVRYGRGRFLCILYAELQLLQHGSAYLLPIV